MFHRTRKTAPLAILALAALLVSEAAGAPEGTGRDVPQAQASDGDHSYLPPWMQPQAGGGKTSMQSQYLNALDDPALKQKTQGTQPPQKPRKRHGSVFDMFF